MLNDFIFVCPLSSYFCSFYNFHLSCHHSKPTKIVLLYPFYNEWNATCDFLICFKFLHVLHTNVILFWCFIFKSINNDILRLQKDAGLIRIYFVALVTLSSTKMGKSQVQFLMLSILGYQLNLNTLNLNILGKVNIV